MKAFTLNIQHGGGRRIAALAEVILAQDADVLVLTEVRDTAPSRKLRELLDQAGYRSQWRPDTPVKKNSVLLASRVGGERVPWGSVAEDYCQRVVGARIQGVRVIGVYFPLGKVKAGLFRELKEYVFGIRDEPVLLMGDFNTGKHHLDEDEATFHCSEEFAALEEVGLVDLWRLEHGKRREFSWFSHVGNGFRVDHIFAKGLVLKSVSQCDYHHEIRSIHASDHSGLSLTWKQVETK